MSSREIITIQCGHYSNFVGTHWWNLQESAFSYDESSKEPKEIANDCTFREGLTLTGEQTYTPRLISLDLSGSLYGLKQDGQLYDNPLTPQRPTWDGKVDQHVTEPAKKNEFLSDLQLLDTGKMETKDMESKQYKLQSGVEVWSDFLRIHLHPKSLLLVPGIFHGKDSRFQTYPAGLEAWDRQFRQQFEDRLHFFVEECDSLQGFQLLVDTEDAFGGLGSCIVQELVEEYGQKGIFSITPSPNTRPLDKSDDFHSTLLTHTLSLDELCTHSSLVCPLSLMANPWRSHTHSHLRPLPSVSYEPALYYHTAALMTVALETASLIYRVHQPPLSLPEMADILTKSGRTVCGMGLCVPFPLPDNSTLLSELDHTPLHLRLHPLTPFCETADKRWAQCVSVRGIPSTYPLCPPDDPRSVYCQRHASLALSSHLSQHFPASSTASHFSVIQKALALANPFPAILPSEYQREKKAPCSAALVSQAGAGRLITALSTELKRLDVRRVPSYASTCLDPDTYGEVKERLVTLAQRYRTSPNLDEPSDSD